ncbi:hypothetical protein D9757_012378 [Collybiopsis confluens]|uniref:DUF6534 domain-containing protein n=1 Tax=Collybiopsis confluens TaxID=2823264 RepID=A0A8H5GJ74_9AGAR|nr:hypothetical protein D9757_012378 [Collybiopsis confluens]
MAVPVSIHTTTFSGLDFFLMRFCCVASYTEYTELAQLVQLDNVSIATNVLGILSDLSITFLMIYLLQRSKTDHRRTTDVLNRLIIFTFNTGIPTSLCSIVTLVLLESAPRTFIYIFIYVSMARFYTNCLLVTLNSRDYIRQGFRSENTTCNDSYAMAGPVESRVEVRNTCQSSPHRSNFNPFIMPKFAAINSNTEGPTISLNESEPRSSKVRVPLERFWIY